MELRELEKYLQKKIFPELEQGRPGIDKPHTESVVLKLKEIVANSLNVKVDLEVLVIAAYAHDWGYTGLFKDGKELKLADVGQQKEKHRKVGGEKLKKLFEDPFFDFLSSERKETAIHLVEKHDLLSQLKDTDELILMEADTLGSLDTSMMTPAFDKESESRYMAKVLEKRRPLFITDYGKKLFEKYFQMRRKFYEDKG